MACRERRRDRGHRREDGVQDAAVVKDRRPSSHPAVSLDEANKRVVEYVKRNLSRESAGAPFTARELAKVAGCSLGTVNKIPIWQFLMRDRRKRGRRNGGGVVDKLDESELAHVIVDPELSELVAQQQADPEISPLADSDGQPSYVRQQRQSRTINGLKF